MHFAICCLKLLDVIHLGDIHPASSLFDLAIRVPIYQSFQTQLFWELETHKQDCDDRNMTDSPGTGTPHPQPGFDMREMRANWGVVRIFPPLVALRILVWVWPALNLPPSPIKEGGVGGHSPHLSSGTAT